MRVAALDAVPRIWTAIAVLFLATPLAAQRVEICAGTVRVAYAVWDGDEIASAGVVSLVEPLVESSRQRVDPAGEGPLTDCAGVTLGGDAATARVPASLLDGQEASAGLVVACADVGELAGSGRYRSARPLSLAASRVRPISLPSDPRGRDRHYLRSSVEPVAGTPARRVWVELRQRLDERVERAVTLFDTVCPADAATSPGS